jgi:hypothetical protein
MKVTTGLGGNTGETILTSQTSNKSHAYRKDFQETGRSIQLILLKYCIFGGNSATLPSAGRN